MKKGYISKDKRKTILFLADDLRLPSGIGTMTKELIIGMAHKFNFVQIGGALNHPDVGKIFDLSPEINKEIGIDDSSVLIYPTNGYGDPDLVRLIVSRHDIDAIIHFTDPRYWVWLYQMSNELRQKTPIIYYHIWDDLPAPLYNRPYYESCDLLLGISKQSYNISKLVLGEGNYIDVNHHNKISAEDWAKPIPKVAYVPHGINTKHYHPLEESAYADLKKQIFGDIDPKFVVLHSNRNIRRKMTSDVILAFKAFLDKNKKKDAYLLMHTDPIDENGTDLPTVIDHLCPEYRDNIILHNAKLSVWDMNKMFNIADVVVNIASNEGWGLSSTEALVTGTPIINNVTGGLQDQLRFADENNNWLELTPEYSSNHVGKYKKHGMWGTAIFPASRNLQGSIPTPYIFDDRVKWEDVAAAFEYWYNMPSDERKEKGWAGYLWATGEEAGFTAEHMTENFAQYVVDLLENWKPIPRFKLFNAEEEVKKHKNKNVGIL